MDERSIGPICLRGIIVGSKHPVPLPPMIYQMHRTNDCSESLLNESQYGSSQNSGDGSGAPGSSPAGVSQQQVPSMSVQNLLNFGRG